MAVPLIAASVSGTVELVNSREPSVRNRKDYSGVVIWLDAAAGQASPSAAATAGRAKMIQKGKRFLPHVLAIPAGSSVDFPNVDPIFHNVFSNFSGQVFDIGLYPPGSSKAVLFKRPGVVRVFCNIHPAMSAVIVVLDTPFFAVTGPGGRFEISGVPPGDYDLHVFHERAAEETPQKLERRITVNGSALELPSMTISENGYLQMPHKNKYGTEYPPPPSDHSAYPGGKP